MRTAVFKGSSRILIGLSEDELMHIIEGETVNAELRRNDRPLSIGIYKDALGAKHKGLVAWLRKRLSREK